MNNYIPTKIKNLSESKERVMRNVINNIENKSTKSKPQFRYLLITALFTLCILFVLINEIPNENEQSATEINSNFTKPEFKDVQGLFYFNGITLNDSQEKVIERLGKSYTIEQEDGNRADIVMNYDDKANFYFYKGKLDSILFMNVDKNYFEKLFDDYDGVKFISPTGPIEDDHYFFSKETGHLIKATAVPNGNLYIYLLQRGKDFLDNPSLPIELISK